LRIANTRAGPEECEAGDSMPAVVVHPQHLDGRRVRADREAWFGDEADHCLDDVKRRNDQERNLGETPLHGDGRSPLFLYGYGAYEACMDPDFGYDWWRSLPSLLDRGVVCAFGQPRGGGELGRRRWWLDGHLRAKPNTFGDQAAVADFLARGFVDGTRIVTRGLSAGGLLQRGLYSLRP
jgi:hypothetical protein